MFFRAANPNSCEAVSLWQAGKTKFVFVIPYVVCTCVYMCITCDACMTILTERLFYVYLQSLTQVEPMFLFYILCFPDLAGSTLSMFLPWETSRFQCKQHPFQPSIRRAEQIQIPDKLKLGPALHLLSTEILAAPLQNISLLATDSFLEDVEVSCVDTRAPWLLSCAGSWCILYIQSRP